MRCMYVRKFFIGLRISVFVLKFMSFYRFDRYLGFFVVFIGCICNYLVLLGSEIHKSNAESSNVQ